MARKKVTAAPLPSPREKALAEIDTQLAHLVALQSAKESELNEFCRQNPNTSWAVAKQDVVNTSTEHIKRLEKSIADLRDRRFQLETAPAATLEALSTSPAKPATANKSARPGPKPALQWKINSVGEPTFPADLSDRKAVNATLDQYIERHVALLQRGLQEAGIAPDRTVTYGALAEIIGGGAGHAVWLNHVVNSLLKRIEELEAGGIKYCGVWQRACDYARGSVVTDAGSAWHAIRGTSPGERPGSSDAWVLMVKAGKDAR